MNKEKQEPEVKEMIMLLNKKLAECSKLSVEINKALKPQENVRVKRERAISGNSSEGAQEKYKAPRNAPATPPATNKRNYKPFNAQVQAAYVAGVNAGFDQMPWQGPHQMPWQGPNVNKQAKHF